MFSYSTKARAEKEYNCLRNARSLIPDRSPMIGLGTIVNVAAIIAGGVCGMLFGRLMSPRLQESLNMACGVCVLFLGSAGAMQGMLSVAEGGALVSGASLLIIVSIVLGTLVGEIINIDRWVSRLGAWLKAKSGSSNDASFVEGFVTASITVCVGAMAVVGSIQDGIYGDHSTLFAKAILDFIIVMCFSCTLGKGCSFSALPVGLFQGSITALAVLIAPLMTDAALANLSLVGSILFFCVGVNLVWGPRIRVANMLPAVLVAPLLAFLPIAL